MPSKDTMRIKISLIPFNCIDCGKGCLGYPWGASVGPDCSDCNHKKMLERMRELGRRLALHREQVTLDILTGKTRP